MTASCEHKGIIPTAQFILIRLAVATATNLDGSPCGRQMVLVEFIGVPAIGLVLPV